MQVGEAVGLAGVADGCSAEEVGAGLRESLRPGAGAVLDGWADGLAATGRPPVWLADTVGDAAAGCLVGDALGDAPAVPGSAMSVGAA
ncbi:hypothetical protein C7C46_01125 [Streptomyces tateyamensis]|uniref:Uncharacterized protein n=1 Tax=Streptomyces tateyamensis TaxID=565073 RepID=A0A2V4NNK5_9ACTN|nr:hypothetical protein C7C46_01125 [Streptomyces tateyamensis]